MVESGEIVVLGMFDLTRLDGAMSVRIYNIYQALRSLTPTTLLAGNRSSRRMATLRFLRQGGLGRTRAIYVEASNGPSNETDLLFLTLARSRGIPILVFIPDAYQLFPDIFPRSGWKAKLIDWGWRYCINTYLRVADVLLFPSWGLAAYFSDGRAKALLPPAGTLGLDYAPPVFSPPTIVYAGGATYRYGSDLLLDAMVQVVARFPNARCRLITNQDEFIAGHPARHAAWLTVEPRTFDELPEIMRSATLTVISLRSNPYNDLAVPVKLFDYMSFGRAVVATACRDTTLLLEQLEAGLVVDDTVESLAQGIIYLLENPDLTARLGLNGYQAIQMAHSWKHRAKRLLELVDEIECDRC
mgnify:CR=1 FL=1